MNVLASLNAVALELKEFAFASRQAAEADGMLFYTSFGLTYTPQWSENYDNYSSILVLKELGYTNVNESLSKIHYSFL